MNNSNVAFWKQVLVVSYCLHRTEQPGSCNFSVADFIWFCMNSLCMSEKVAIGKVFCLHFVQFFVNIVKSYFPNPRFRDLTCCPKVLITSFDSWLSTVIASLVPQLLSVVLNGLKHIPKIPIKFYDHLWSYLSIMRSLLYDFL